MQKTVELTKTKILNNLRKMNELWKDGRIDELGIFFHENVVIVHPGFSGRAEGKEVILQSFRDFISKAEILKMKESDFSIDLWEDTAVASYMYQMDWRMGGKEFSETGHDLYTFIKENGNWVVVWRTLIPKKDN